MFQSKNTLAYLIALLVLVSILSYIWYKRTINTENITMPHQDIYWKQISGEDEFRNQPMDSSSNLNTILPYTTVPMQNDTRFINGMNKYLWDKQKKTETS